VLNNLVFSAKYVLGIVAPDRLIEVPPDATFLVSFPKSGNTWTRFLIGNLTHPNEPVTFANVDRIVPDVHGAAVRDLGAALPPRVFKSHESFDPRYRRVIYIVRDPRDVAVSSYHFARKGRHIPDSLPLETYISTIFLRRGHTYGSWAEHLRSWLVNQSNISQMLRRQIFSTGHIADVGSLRRRFMLLRYEDLLDNTERELAKVAEFMGLNTSSEQISRAVAASSVDKMKQLEQKQSHLWGSTKEGRQDIRFVREGRSGQWKKSLSATSVAEIESAWGYLIATLGYELTLTSQNLTDSRT
jgi:Sulfotransferase domain